MMFNPYQYQYRPQMQTEVIKVRGRESAQSINLAPNCSVLLLDETAPIVWLCVSDGVGRVTATPYDISVHEEKPVADSSEIEKRVEKIELAIAEMEERLNGKSDVGKIVSKQSLADDAKHE